MYSTSIILVVCVVAEILTVVMVYAVYNDYMCTYLVTTSVLFNKYYYNMTTLY